MCAVCAVPALVIHDLSSVSDDVMTPGTLLSHCSCNASVVKFIDCNCVTKESNKADLT